MATARVVTPNTPQPAKSCIVVATLALAILLPLNETCIVNAEPDV
ncbi:MAG TPA: hypothetical protein VFA10_15495 [Ktedonobacteraceae bacterium]|nr:hypothetical protein [Ktedonobacteraceae bacterium]